MVFPFQDFTGGQVPAGNNGSGGFNFGSLFGGGGASTSPVLGGLGGGLGALASAFTGQAGGAQNIGNLVGQGLSLLPGGQFLAPAVSGLISKLGHHGKPGHEDPDIEKVAIAANISWDEAQRVLAYEESHTPQKYDEVCKKYANNPSGFPAAVAEYNRTHPNTPVVLQPASPLAASGFVPSSMLQLPQNVATSAGFLSSQFPMASTVQTFGQLPSSSLTLPRSVVTGGGMMANSVADPSLKDYIDGVIKGAQQGAGDVFAGSTQGKILQNQGAKQWASDNGIFIGLGAAGVVALAIKAFSK